ARILAVSSYLVNERSARLDAELAPGARVDVLPPFAGG
ncbi:MAG: MoaD/ThiS family protein, partial [Actinomyces sp.]|nr:MoaD/ThiS family protein [Actinomyces sp.]